MRFLPLILVFIAACTNGSRVHSTYTFQGNTNVQYDSEVYDSLNGNTIITHWDSVYNDIVMQHRKLSVHHIQFNSSTQLHIGAMPQLVFEFNDTDPVYLFAIDSMSTVKFFYTSGTRDSLHMEYRKDVNKPGNELHILLQFTGI